jgi:alkanesulfonate monooxygenase SsuD/methylene tetrahydromethanopterin reductase-like flavin-dependent oxidoreductase (luciferase family)
MAALSQVTESVRIGQMCTCNSYRNPAYLTKVASTIDSMSGGRLEFAIGAGWYDQEYKAYGYEYPSAGVRLKMLEEALQIYIAMNTENKASFEGEYYSIKNAINQPKPLQKPYPPLWVCGGGEKVTLKLLAKYGDYGNWDVDIKGFIHKSEILKDHCEQQKREYSEIKKTLHTNVIIGENQKDLDNKISKITEVTGIPKEMYINKPLVGTVDKVFDAIDEFKSIECAYIIAYVPDIVWGNSLEILSQKI